jgi:tetratricopeptide (TPR) repeat protein
MALAYPALPVLGQSASPQFLVRRTPAQSVVSTNQLLTPQKARKAIELAHEDLLRGRFDEADKQAKRALNISPHCANALSVEGILRMRDGNFQESVVWFQKAIIADPTLGVAYLGMGQALNRQSRFKEALVPLDRAAIFLPDTWNVYFETASAKLGVGELDASLKEVQNAERLVRNDPIAGSAVSFLRGLAHSRLRNYAKAREDFEDAMKGDPKGPYGLTAKHELDKLELVFVIGRK